MKSPSNFFCKQNIMKNKHTTKQTITERLAADKYKYHVEKLSSRIGYSGYFSSSIIFPLLIFDVSKSGRLDVKLEEEIFSDARI